jgi:hypothetical protein
MKKLSEIIRIGLAEYEWRAATRQRVGLTVNHNQPAMCGCIVSALDHRRLRWDEMERFNKAIRQRIGHSTYLGDVLRKQKKGSSYAHRLAYYKRWIAQLEKKGL